MSVDMTHIIGVGIRLDYDKWYNAIDTYEDNHRDLRLYDYDESNKVRFVVDGMAGEYIYIMYVLKATDIEDMYDSEACFEIDVNAIPVMKKEVMRVFEDVIAESDIDPTIIADASAPSLISVFHCT